VIHYLLISSVSDKEISDEDEDNPVLPGARIKEMKIGDQRAVTLLG
jgi:hypothetical protein